jgi:hypothetical protein
MDVLGEAAEIDAVVAFAGGATAVLIGWRPTTRDVDLVIEPPAAEAQLGPHIPAMKERLQLNIEFASPSHFIGELPGARDRRLFIDQLAKVAFYHEDPYSQALAKVARGFEWDRLDVAAMLERRLVVPVRAWELFDAAVPQLYRSAIDAGVFEERMMRAFGPRQTDE